MVDLELARRCARAYIENELYALTHEAPRYLWDLCPEAYAAIEGDDDARDELWNAVCQELEDATVTYRLKGESAADAERHRLLEEAQRLARKVTEAQDHYQAAVSKLRAAERDALPKGDFDHDRCTHATHVELDGHLLCTAGCGKDLGSA